MPSSSSINPRPPHPSASEMVFDRGPPTVRPATSTGTHTTTNKPPVHHPREAAAAKRTSSKSSPALGTSTETESPCSLLTATRPSAPPTSSSAVINDSPAATPHVNAPVTNLDSSAMNGYCSSFTASSTSVCIFSTATQNMHTPPALLTTGVDGLASSAHTGASAVMTPTTLTTAGTDMSTGKRYDSSLVPSPPPLCHILPVDGAMPTRLHSDLGNTNASKLNTNSGNNNISNNTSGPGSSTSGSSSVRPAATSAATTSAKSSSDKNASSHANSLSSAPQRAAAKGHRPSRKTREAEVSFAEFPATALLTKQLQRSGQLGNLDGTASLPGSNHNNECAAGSPGAPAGPLVGGSLSPSSVGGGTTPPTFPASPRTAVGAGATGAEFSPPSAAVNSHSYFPAPPVLPSTVNNGTVETSAVDSLQPLLMVAADGDSVEGVSTARHSPATSRRRSINNTNSNASQSHSHSNVLGSTGASLQSGVAVGASVASDMASTGNTARHQHHHSGSHLGNEKMAASPSHFNGGSSVHTTGAGFMDSSVTSFADTSRTDEMNYLFGSCYIPLNAAVMFNILITVTLVAVLSIFPLNAVSIRSMDHVTTTLSGTVASTLAESINANLYFLPIAVKNFASAWQLNREVQAWPWTKEAMEFTMQQICEMSSFSRSSSHMLYLVLQSPISGYAAYCSPQYSSKFLVGRYVVDNKSSYRYYIDSDTFRYEDPPRVYHAANSMSVWEATVEFGGESNPWHRVALPWWDYYLDLLKRCRDEEDDDSSKGRAITEDAAGVTAVPRTTAAAADARVWSPRKKRSRRRTAAVSLVRPSSGRTHLSVPANVDSSDQMQERHQQVQKAAEPVDRAATRTSASSTVNADGVPRGSRHRDRAVTHRVDSMTSDIPSVEIEGGGDCDEDDEGYMNSVEDGWLVYTYDGYSIITYSIPFVDYLGNLAIITGAVQPTGISAVFPNGVLPTDIGRAMAVDPDSGMVLMNSWGEETRVYFDNWNTSDPEGLRLSRMRGLYMEQVEDDLMLAAVAHLGGKAGLAEKPLEVTRWQVKFTHGKSDAIAIANRIVDISGNLNFIVIYAVQRSEYTENIGTVRTAVIISVVVILIIIALVDMVLVYLFLQPLRGVAAGLHDASQLKDGSMSAEGRISIIKEVADMQYHFKVMNMQLMRMKTFVPQGVLHPMSTWSGSDGHPDPDFGGSFGDGHVGEGLGLDCTGNGGLNDGAGNDSFAIAVNAAAGLVAASGGGGGAVHHGALHLNERVLFDEINKFHRRYCSMAVFFMHFRECDTSVPVIEAITEAFMKSVIPSVLRHGGILEIQRPELMLVSFGAHSRMSMHHTRAAKCALEVMDVVNQNRTISPRVGCLLDVGEGFVGTCGADQRHARVSFGFRNPTGADLIKLAKSLGCQILLTQRMASAIDEHLITLPVDCILFPLTTKKTLLYELRGSTKQLPSSAVEEDVRGMVQQVKLAFHRMTKGEYASALSLFLPYEPLDRQVARLAGACRVLVSKGISKPFVRTLDRIRISEADTNYDVDGDAMGVNTDAQRLQLRHDSLRNVPQTPGLDSTLMLVNGGPTRIIEGVSMHDAYLENKSLNDTSGDGVAETGNASLALADGVEGDGDDGCALFEMFIDAEDDDDVSAGGGGGAGGGEGGDGGESGAVVGAGNSGTGELPTQFVDYEGNRWTRSMDRLGQGAFSVVYRGLSQSGNLVALKCFQLRARNVDVHAITEEVSVFANLHHENIVQYISIYVSNFFIIEIMEFVPGGSLDTLLISFGSVSENAVRRYLRDILRGLSYLHSMSIVHCDIKPHNVLLAMDGQCKLSDFGSALARATTSVCKIDDVLEMRGTPGYMAPEVARGEVPTVKSDVFSLGVTILELLTGKLPWQYVRCRSKLDACDGSSVDLNGGGRPPTDSATLPSHTTVGGAAADCGAVGTHALVSDYAELQSPTDMRDGGANTTFGAAAAAAAAAAAGTSSFAAPALRPRTSSYSAPEGAAQQQQHYLHADSGGHPIPIEQVLRNAANLISSIGRNVVHPVVPGHLGEEVKDFLLMCVDPDPNQRPTVDELLTHPWLM